MSEETGRTIGSGSAAPPPPPSTVPPDPASTVVPEPVGEVPAVWEPEAAEEPDGTAELALSKFRGLWVGVTIFAIVLLFLLIFILQNLAAANVAFLGATVSLPIGVALLLAAICGVLLVAIPGYLRILQLRRVRAPRPAGRADGAPAGRCPAARGRACADVRLWDHPVRHHPPRARRDVRLGRCGRPGAPAHRRRGRGLPQRHRCGRRARRGGAAGVDQVGQLRRCAAVPLRAGHGRARRAAADPRATGAQPRDAGGHAGLRAARRRRLPPGRDGFPARRGGCEARRAGAGRPP